MSIWGIVRFGARFGVGGEVLAEGFLGGEPVSAEFTAFKFAPAQEVADVRLGIACQLRRLLDGDPFGQDLLLELGSNALLQWSVTESGEWE